MKRSLLILMVALLLVGCGSTSETSSSYEKISPEAALELMIDGNLILDVRTESEYISGHIPEAQLLPLDLIQAGQLELLEDKDQIILVYCRSGNRSRTAANALIEAGYTKVYDFGGIKDWPYDIVQ